MTTTATLIENPRVRTLFHAGDGGACSNEWIFSRPIADLADEFNGMTPEAQQRFGNPKPDELATGIELWLRFVAFARTKGVNVTDTGTCFHYKREKHPDVIVTISYNEKFPFTSIDLKPKA